HKKPYYKNCVYRPDSVLQIDAISWFLKDCIGFTLHPVMGLPTLYDFLNGLTICIFHPTQYTCHHFRPTYMPEPDCCHELLGHMPLFADPKFAELVQEIGLAPLGISDEEIQRLMTIFWFTADFSFCHE
ncbi:hypothetical protein GGF37_004124, partial [Kickxella alabastrina]